MAIEGIYDFSELALKQGKKIISVPLKDKTTVKILWNDRSADVFQVSENKILQARRLRGNSEKINLFIKDAINRIQKSAKDGIDILTIWAEKNSKK